ncbi:GNAT family N-acetyltransferase [Paenibacillus peoriae]|uniref:GNAT family N-acetyltransferase n=1 Tax=Paenibacillus peoriae TaxID=59893 RepID=UPI003F9EB0EC
MIELIRYNDSHFEELMRFLKENWAPNHAIYDKALFNWQYRVNAQGESVSQLLVQEDQIIGFLGNIPGHFSVAGEKLTGAGLTMWIIDKAYRETGLGIRILIETEKRFPVTYTLGCGPQVVPLYKRMGYTYMEALNRYVLPLDSVGYQKLLPEAVNRTDIEEWINQVFRDSNNLEMPCHNISAEQLERLYINTIQKHFVFSQYRDADYWNWRYANSCGYTYHYLGNPETAGVVIVRIDKVYNPDDRPLHGTAVLRIIEALPANGDVWNGAKDENFIALLRGLLRWAKKIGCVAADFQISNNRIEHILSKVGFQKQNIDYSPNLCGLAGLFQPYRLKVNRINFAWKVKSDNGKNRVYHPEDTYFVKSDCDMDRPNIWPLPKGWNI